MRVLILHGHFATEKGVSIGAKNSPLLTINPVLLCSTSDPTATGLRVMHSRQASRDGLKTKYRGITIYAKS
jgi:hypothetical protein